jgi:YwiC-like protein
VSASGPAPRPAAARPPELVTPAAPSVRSVALPVEHGGWGLLGEPLLLGLLLAPSVPGLGLALASLGAFLARHPLKLVLADRRRRTRYPRTALAERFVLLYGAITLAGLAVALTGPRAAWIPLLVATPLALIQLGYDAKHHGRALAPELLGAVALGAVAAAILLAGGWPARVAVGAWVLLAVKAVTCVLYVRARFRLDRGLGGSTTPVLAAHALAMGLAVALALSGGGPWLGTLAFALLTGRAAHGLSSHRPPLKPRQLGMRELVYGITTTGLLALGYGVRL